MLSLLLGIANARQGVVIVDEIENGIHHEKMSDVWKALLEFADRFKAQLFISTHSLEAIKHLQPVIQKHEGQFSLMRAEKRDGQHIVRQFTGASFRRAIEQKIEIR